VVVVAIVVSVLLHAIALVLLGRFAPARLALAPGLGEPVRVALIEPPPMPAGEPAPDSPFRSSVDSAGERKVPETPPEGAPSDKRARAPRVPERPAAEPETEPQPGIRGVAPPEDPEAQRRRKISDVVSALRNRGSWDDALEGDGPELELGGGGSGGYGADLQFESKADVDWGPYAARIKHIVRGNWRIPIAAQAGVEGIVQLHFFIRRDGVIEELQTVSASGELPLDIAARDALALSSALPPPPLPEDLDEERVGVVWTFIYNMDDREYARWERLQRWGARRSPPQP
jgi:outer membrane biosynthesis protein TonB